MKRFSLFLILSTTVFQLFAQSSTGVESSSVVINFTAIILFVVIAAHMVYKTFLEITSEQTIPPRSLMSLVRRRVCHH